MQEYLYSNELRKARQEEIERGVDDNNCVANVETEIDVVKDLIKSKKNGAGHEIDKENPRCPNCYSVLKEYIYGKIKGEIDTNKYIVGGCILRENNPTYHCSKCKYDYDNNLNLMTETLEKLIKDSVKNDHFWEDLLKKYFNSLNNKNYEEKISFFKILILDKTIFNEFTKELVKNENPKELYEKYIN